MIYLNDLADNKMDDTKYKESLLANLYSQVEFLKEELKEKNDVIRNLLNRIKSNNCVIFPKMSMTNDDESYIETSSESTMENENQNLI